MRPENPISVLSIEDDPQAQELMDEILKRLKRDGVPLNTFFASSLAEVRDYLRQGYKLDLVFLDLILGTDYTFSLIQELHQQGIKVIVISGYTRSGTKEACLEAGAVQFISKPYDVEEVMRTIQDLQKPKE